MSRIRTLKPEMLEDEKVAALPDRPWRAFVSCILLADDHGNLRGDTRWLTGQAFWAADPSPVTTEAAVLELARRGFLRPYSVRGQRYLAIVGWSRHQKVNKPGGPRVPRPTEDDGSLPSLVGSITCDDPPNSPGDSRPDPDRRTPTTTPTNLSAADAPEPATEKRSRRKPATSEPAEKPAKLPPGTAGECARAWMAHYRTEAPPTWGGECARLNTLAQTHGAEAEVSGFKAYLACEDEFYKGHPLSLYVGARSHDRFCGRLKSAPGRALPPRPRVGARKPDDRCCPHAEHSGAHELDMEARVIRCTLCPCERPSLREAVS